jgi:hypothetical protein
VDDAAGGRPAANPLSHGRASLADRGGWTCGRFTCPRPRARRVAAAVSTGTILVVTGAFLARGLEVVEALTIVLGVGVVRGWRSTLIGAGAAGIALEILVAALGPALSSIPIGTLRLVVGALLLAFGLQWLPKAILRSSGYKELHDEEETFQSERVQAATARDDRRADWTGIPSRSLQGRPTRRTRGRLHRDRLRQRPGQLGLARIAATCHPPACTELAERFS